MEGAENTLVGSAVLKFIGFLKRKGTQYYLSTVLKPKLGKIYMNGILRYAIKNGITNFPIKESFVVEKLNEKNENVVFDNKISFEKDDIVGLKSFQVGANVKTEKTSPQLEDGYYLLKINYKTYVVNHKLTIYLQLFNNFIDFLEELFFEKIRRKKIIF